MARVLTEAGRIDAVVNNAGYGIAGPIEATPLSEALDLFQTNFFGALRVCQAVLPHFRARKAGRIITISSLAGRVALPYQGLYSASKFALSGLTEALRMEVAPLGIGSSSSSPGTSGPRSPPTAGAWRRWTRPTGRGSCGPSPARRDERTGAPPEAVARLVLRILRHPRPKPRYTVGNPFQRLAVGLRGVLPSRLVEWGIMRYYRAF